MAQWHHLLKLDSELQARVREIYERTFPREIRHSLCTVMEEQDWDSAAVDVNKAAACLSALLMYLEEQWARSVQQNNILQAPDFTGMKDYLVRHFRADPQKLARILSECLKEERKVLSSASETQACGSPTMEQKWKQLDDKVNELQRLTSEVKKETKSLEELNERLDTIQLQWQSQVEQHVGLAQSQAQMEEKCLPHVSFISQTKKMLLQQIRTILMLSEQATLTLTGVELPEWKRRQQLACIGAPVDTSLSLLEKWFTVLAEVLFEVREQLQKLQEQNDSLSGHEAFEIPASIAEMDRCSLALLTKLLSNALVVEKQPVMTSSPQRPLIVKTCVRFTVTVRFLANLPRFKDQLKVRPVFDKDVEEVKTLKGFRRFELTKDDFKVMDVDSPCGGLVVQYHNMCIKDAKVNPRKGSSETRLAVTEELHIIKFVTQLRHAGLECDIEASCLPIVVISSSIQASSAWASIMWSNILDTSEPKDLSLFIDPPALTWEQLAQVLSWQFLTVGQRGLDEDQLSMLKDKIVDDSGDGVCWYKFSKNEQAWIWIDGILDLIKKHLLDLWRDGCIMGFVSRARTRALLQEKQTGTFLLRFSETNKDGAITFSWVEHANGACGSPAEAQVTAVEPYTKQELAIMCLPDIICEYSLRAQKNMTRNALLYLYPDIPKDAAFGRYYKSSAMCAPKNVVDGYVHRTTVHVSLFPTPPPSPPRQRCVLDFDMEMETARDDSMDIHSQILEELFSDLLNTSYPFSS